MAVSYSGDTITCLSGDVKPTGLRTGICIKETDTLNYYYWNGSAWTLIVSTAGGATVTTQRIVKSGNSTTTSATFVDAPGLTITLPTRTGGKALLIADMDIANSGGFRWVDGATNKEGFLMSGSTAAELHYSMSYVASLSGQVLKIQWQSAGGTATLYGDGTNGNSTITSFEIS